MSEFANYNGYDPLFINPETPIQLPVFTTESQEDDVAAVTGTADKVARYINYSVVLSSSRGFPYFSVSNIDGKNFKKAPRNDNWRKDSRINASHQWGNELYKAPVSDFDKGHLTKREDVQWGPTVVEAEDAADSTFYYTNAIPQHAKLNQRIWKKLEDYVLATETVPNNLRITVMTGPVLSPNDPTFVTPVKGKKIQLPTLFWKIIYFPKSNGEIFRVGFMMGQQTLLEKHGIIDPIEEPIEETVTPEDLLFMQFKNAKTYQVDVRTIEELAKLTMPSATDSYHDTRPRELLLAQIDVNLESTSDSLRTLGYKIDNLIL